MDTPQEIQVWLILPAVRKELAICLKNTGLKQKEIASKLGLTEAAVSQYVKEKRGQVIDFPPAIRKLISSAADKISDNPKIYRAEIQNIMKEISENKFICEVCHKHTDSLKNCKICY